MASTSLCAKKGFTLIEILISFAILGILTAVTVPSLIGFKRNQDLNFDKVRITGFLNSARDKATTSEGGARFGVRIKKDQAGNETYQLVQFNAQAMSACYAILTIPPPVTVIETKELKSAVSFIGLANGDTQDFVFAPLSGTPDPVSGICHANQITIHLEGSSNPQEQKTIIINNAGTITSS